MSGIFPLEGVVKHYDWGGTRFIPELTGLKNPGDRPFAEYWMGIHPAGSAVLTTPEGKKNLSEITGPLPFLLKILDVREMLSIQVHPTKDGARDGFERYFLQYGLRDHGGVGALLLGGLVLARFSWARGGYQAGYGHKSCEREDISILHTLHFPGACPDRPPRCI